MADLCNVCHKPVSEHRDNLMCCPFCGTPDVRPVDIIRKSGSHIVIECFPCGARSPRFDRIEECGVWNRRASGWIACGDRMPEDEMGVLVYADGEIWEGAFDPGHGWIVGGTAGFPFPVTHWMPLPAPPKEATK